MTSLGRPIKALHNVCTSTCMPGRCAGSLELPVKMEAVGIEVTWTESRLPWSPGVGTRQANLDAHKNYSAADRYRNNICTPAPTNEEKSCRAPVCMLVARHKRQPNGSKHAHESVFSEVDEGELQLCLMPECTRHGVREAETSLNTNVSRVLVGC